VSTVSHGPSRLREVLIDDSTWDAADIARRAEWLSAIADLVADHHFDLPGESGLRLLVTDAPEHITLDLVDDGGQLVARASLPASALADSLHEYVETCREMTRLGVGDNSPRLEALDIAKRLIHDEAAEIVQRLCRVLRPDHSTARRLFTLAVTLRHDTTRL
jgi:uncharacterized protein (UPF0262 family)